MLTQQYSRIFQALRRFVAEPLWAMLAPLHCGSCGRALNTHTPVSYQFSRICQQCSDAFAPAPPPEELLNRLVTGFPPDAIALTKIVARYSVQQQPIYDASTGTTLTANPQSMVYAMKYYSSPSFARECGQELGILLHALGMVQYDAIVPVPLHRARERERGYNQSSMLALGVSSVLSIPVYETYLRRTHYTVSQTLLSASERRTNVQNAFAAVPSSARSSVRSSVRCPAHVLLVDDVFTTGSTLNACASALLESGVRRVDAATLCAA